MLKSLSSQLSFFYYSSLSAFLAAKTASVTQNQKRDDHFKLICTRISGS